MLNYVEIVNGREVQRTILDPCEGFIGKPYIDLNVRLAAEIRFWTNQIDSVHTTDSFREVAVEQLRKCKEFDVNAHSVFDPDYFTK